MGYAKNLLIEQELGISKSIVKCKHCGKKYKQVVEDQTPGFKDMEYDICPYCKKENGRSMSEEYSNYKIEGEE